MKRTGWGSGFVWVPLLVSKGRRGDRTMKNRVLLSFLLISTASLAGCGDAAAPQSQPSPIPSASTRTVPFDCEDAKYSQSVDAEPFECKTFTSIAGSASAQDLSWLTSTPLHMSFSRMNGSLTMVVRMPCGVLNVPVSVVAEAMTPDSAGMVESADGCSGPAAEQRAWTTAYFKTQLTYSLGKQSLVFTNDLGQIVFKRT